MKRGARDSQIVNNFFSLATIVIIAVVITLYTKYIVKDDEAPNTKKEIVKLACENESYTYSKIFNQKLLDKSHKALYKGYYKLEGSFLKAEYMPSNIENIISLEEIDKVYTSSIGTEPKKNIEKFLKIKYEIIENDKKNPSKKDEKCKLNAGSIMTSFRINSTEIFRVYTDFSFMFKNEIKKRVECSVKVFKNHVQK